MYSDLSDKQLAILNFIKSEIKSKGYPPSVREICNAVGLKSTSTVHSHLNKLETKGYIRKDPTKPRTIEVLDSNGDSSDVKKDVVSLPVVGNVTAGSPILAVENIEEFLPIPKSFLSGSNNFILKVKGESMINAGILDGDYIIVKQSSTAENGQMVVALIDGFESTVKTFYKEANRIRLQPENSFMEPIYADDIKILGIVKGVFRSLK